MILIVDDDESIVMLLKKYLQKSIHGEVMAVSNAEAALAAISSDIDLVLLDINLPQMNGIDLCKLIRQKKEYSFLPIIMITASEDQEVLSHAFAAGATDFLSKPIKKAELLARVKVATALNFEMKRRICYEAKLEKVLKNALIQVNAINAAANGIVILDREKKIVWANKAATHIFSCKNKGLVGMKLRDTSLTSPSQDNLDGMWERTRQGEAQKSILKLKKEIGHLWLETSLSPVKNSHGKHEHYVLILQDVTFQEITKQRVARDLDLARSIQRSLLPIDINQPKLTVEGFSISAEKLGGDLYYWNRHDDGLTVILSADIMGHGIASALISMLVRAILPDLMHSSKSAANIVQQLDAHIRRLWKDNSEEFFFVTGICLVVDPINKTVSYVNAGHPGGIALIDKEMVQLSKGTLPIGLIEEANIEEGFIHFNKLEMFLFSDGIYDIMDNNIDSAHDYLKKNLLSSHENKIQQISSHLTKVCAEIDTIPDDISMIYVSIS